MSTTVLFLRERIFNLAQLQDMINTAIRNLEANRCGLIDVKLTTYGEASNGTVLVMIISGCESDGPE